MLFLLGLSGLVQLTALPGAIFLLFLRIRPRSVYETLVTTFAASLILNYLLASLLVLIHAHNRRAWLAIIAAELLALTLLTMRRRPLDLSTEPVPSRAPQLAAALALVTVLAFVPLLYENWGSVYTANDDVASWDRWARDWSANRAPVGAKLYPQLLPANWSITYALLGTGEIKMFGKAIMPLFPLGILLIFLSLQRRLHDPGYWTGAAFAALLLFVYLGAPFLMSGYTDVASAFFSFLSFSLLHARHHDEEGAFATPLALVFASGAALAKQGGLFVLAVIVIWGLSGALRTRSGTRAPRLAWAAALTTLAAVSLWYGLQFYATYKGAEASNIKFLTIDIHEGRGIPERIVYACRLLISRGGELGGLIFWGSASLLVAGLLISRTRTLIGIFVLPGFLLWAGLFSYETRTAAILFPFASLAMGLAAGGVLSRLASAWGSRRQLSPRARLLAIAVVLLVCARGLHFFGHGTAALESVYFWPLLAAATLYAGRFAVEPLTALPRFRVHAPALALFALLLAAAAGTVHYPNTQLLNQQLRAQRAIGKPEVNAHLYELFERGQLNQPVISNYWYFQSLPDIGPLNRLITCGANCTLDNVLRDVELTPEAHFLLVEDLFLPPSTVRSLAFCRGLESVFAEGTVRMFRIHRERFEARATSCKADPELSRPAIIKLYPPATTAGTGFNLQPDGMSALGVQCRNASQSSVIYWNGNALASAFGGADAVSGLVPPRFYAKRGKYPIEVQDRETGMRSAPFVFEVK